MNVLVYFHGGAFMFASGIIYTPEYILQNDDIVFISVNYRLGALGKNIRVEKFTGIF